MIDPQFHVKQLAAALSVLNSQVVTNTNGSRKSIVGIPTKGLPDQKGIAKVSLGTEVDKLGPGDYFGHEALLQVDDLALVSAIATEYTELLRIDARMFEEKLLSYFESDLYSKALYLANLDIFSSWSPYLLRELAISIRETKFNSGDCLFRQGMPFSHILILRSGIVRLTAGNTSKPPQELLDQIKPPKDYLSEILAEARPPQKPPSGTQGPTASCSMLLLSASLSTSHALLTQSRISLKHSSTPHLQKRKYSRKKPSENRRPIMCFRLKEPRLSSSSQLCCLGPGNMLNHTEAICKVKHSLFDAVAVSDTVVYTVDTLTFVQLLEKKSTRTLLSLNKQVSRKVQSWLSRHPNVGFFKPLLQVLQQSLTELESGKGNNESRKYSTYLPEKRAYAAVKTLGKKLTPDLQIYPCHQSSSAYSKPRIETSAEKKHLIRQLTQCQSLGTDNLYIKKETTSFDSPLPRTYFPTHRSPSANTSLSPSTHSSSSSFSDTDNYSEQQLQQTSRFINAQEFTTLKSPPETAFRSCLPLQISATTTMKDFESSRCANDLKHLNEAMFDASVITLSRPVWENHTQSSYCDSFVRENSVISPDPHMLLLDERRHQLISHKTATPRTIRPRK